MWDSTCYIFWPVGPLSRMLQVVQKFTWCGITFSGLGEGALYAMSVNLREGMHVFPEQYPMRFKFCHTYALHEKISIEYNEIMSEQI